MKTNNNYRDFICEVKSAKNLFKNSHLFTFFVGSYDSKPLVIIKDNLTIAITTQEILTEIDLKYYTTHIAGKSKTRLMSVCMDKRLNRLLTSGVIIRDSGSEYYLDYMVEYLRDYPKMVTQISSSIHENKEISFENDRVTYQVQKQTNGILRYVLNLKV